jgi:hypothetical protein
MHARTTTHAPWTATLAILAVALGGCSTADDDDATARNAGDVTSAPAVTPTGHTETEGARTPSGAAIVGEISNGTLQPGRYALPPIGPRDEPFAVVTIPSGYSSWESFIEADQPAESEDPLMLGLWAITGVYVNPCAQANQVSPKSVRAIAAAFLHQRLTSATRPRKVDLAGYHGLYLEVTAPTDLDYDTCDDAEMSLWDARPDGGYWTRMPGMVNQLWILRVDGQPMVVHLAVPPSATGQQVHAMTDIVETAAFETSHGP